MKVNPYGESCTRHSGVVQVIDTATKAAGLVRAVYDAGRVVMQYVRPAVAALAAAA